MEALRALHPDVEFLQEVSDETRLIVSEPLGDLRGVWNEVPESSYGVVRPGGDDLIPFAPQPVQGLRRPPRRPASRRRDLPPVQRGRPGTTPRFRAWMCRPARIGGRASRGPRARTAHRAPRWPHRLRVDARLR
ncbi:hypothetical protein GCM10010269_79130 [Streptomyces humidus]|uniref:Uncharacterized protein n=1 Tax=Streptomyces humidus TaxID=52259 RepID=A0A918GC51_9ACTN|nr:hypothetical protein GCM10010269_79130 [Streptomyces humidus]